MQAYTLGKIEALQKLGMKGSTITGVIGKARTARGLPADDALEGLAKAYDDVRGPKTVGSSAATKSRKDLADAANKVRKDEYAVIRKNRASVADTPESRAAYNKKMQLAPRLIKWERKDRSNKNIYSPSHVEGVENQKSLLASTIRRAQEEARKAR